MASVRARLEALKNDNEQPYHVAGARAMYIGKRKIMLCDRSGNPAFAGHAWLDIGGRDRVRYQGGIQRTEHTRYAMEGGERHILQKLAQGRDGPEWRLTATGKLRPRQHTCAVESFD